MFTQYCRCAIDLPTSRPLPILLSTALAFFLSGAAVTAGATDTNVLAITTLKVFRATEGTSEARLAFGPIFSDHAYTVETCTDLASANWTALAPDRVTDIGGQRALTETPVTDTRKFYRVTINSQPPEFLSIRSDQPRLFWNSRIATNVSAKPSDSDGFFYNVRKKMMNFPAAPDELDTNAIIAEMQELVTNNTSGEFFNTAMGYGLCAFLSEGTDYAPAYRAYAESFLAALCARTFTQSDNDLGPREKLYALGVLYDWLFLDASTELGRTVHQQILGLLGDLEAWQTCFSNPHFSGGHGRYANVCALAALLAIRQGIENDAGADLAAYFGWLALVVRNWREGFNPTLAWMAQDGGYGMGWSYGQDYTSTDPYVMWDNATTEERWNTAWQRERALFQVYGARNSAYDETVRHEGAYETFPYSGDVYSTRFFIPNFGPHLLLAGEPSAAWLYGLLASEYRANYWEHLLFCDPAASALSPETLGLPLARSFGVSGYVLMRDSWDLDANTLLEFKSTAYHHVNHHHLDQNAFTIFFRGPLAIDSGGYNIFGGYTADHSRNYYRRSVAHNTILVYDPAECFGSPSDPDSNDGGQKYATGAMAEYPTLAQMRPGGVNALDGILAFEDRPDFAYALGDSSKAYAASKLSDFRRSVVYLRNFAGTHPVIVVHDRVVSTSPAFAKTYLLHAINEPVITGRIVTIAIDDGPNTNKTAGLIQETILPADATLTAVGGPGKEFWVDDNGHGQGTNYIEGLSTDSEDETFIREAGKWRVEVKPGSAREADSFLHVLTVTETNTAGGAVATCLPSTDDFDGVVVQQPGTSNLAPGTGLVFHHGSAPLDLTLERATLPALGRILVVGLAPGAPVELTQTTTQFHLRATVSGSLRTSDQGVLVIDMPYREGFGFR